MERLSRRRFVAGTAAAGFVGAVPASSLDSAEPALLPAPQQVQWQGKQISLGPDWALAPAPGLGEGHIALRTLRDGLSGRRGLRLALADRPSRVIRLVIQPGSAAAGKSESISRQGYRLRIEPQLVTLAGNDGPGLLNAVSTLLQLLDSAGDNSQLLPVCEMDDWPDLELRIVHWCEKEHQSRMDTLKEYLDRAAYFKINAIGWHIENTFAYRKHPAIALPTAFTAEQVREIEQYANERFIELIPMVDFPAHMSYVLRHPEFAHLREVANSSYMICPTNPESWRLILDMLGEVCDAFRGKYFLFSTDELFFDQYRGTTCGCTKRINEVGPSGLFVDISLKASDFLMEQGKQVMFWGERPLEVKDIPKLPSSMIDAAAGWYSLERPGELEMERKHGMKVLMYFSMKGGEKQLFPDYLPFRHHDIFSRNHLDSAWEILSFGATRKSDNVLGTFMAAWDDHGLNLEIIWLGLVAGSAYGWRAADPAAAELLPRFAKLFFGTDPARIAETYELMNDCALFWSYSWDRRKGIALPNLPDPGTLDNKPFWRQQYAHIGFRKDVSQAKQAVAHQKYVPNARSESVFDDLKKEKDLTSRLVQLLRSSLPGIPRHRYSLEVFLAIARAMDHNVNLLAALGLTEDVLGEAYRAAQAGQHSEAVSRLVSAERTILENCAARERLYQELRDTWEKSRFPSPQMDVFRRERALGLENWAAKLQRIRLDYAGRHHVAN